MQEVNNKIPLLMKVRMTLLCMLVNAGVLYFYEAFKNFTLDKSDQVLGIILFGIAFAYTMNYDFSLPKTKKTKINKDINKPSK